MMNANEIEYVLEQIDNKTNGIGDVYFEDEHGKLKVVDYLYHDNDGNLILTNTKLKKETMKWLQKK